MLNDSWISPDHGDTTARHRQIASAALDRTETWARRGKPRSATSDMLPEAMLVADETGIIISVNSQFELMFGYHRSEIIGQSPEILLPLAARARHIQHRMNYANRPEVRKMAHGTDVLARHKNGTEFKVLVNLGPVVVPAGRITPSSVSEACGPRAMELWALVSQHPTQVWAAASAFVSATGAWLLSIRNAAASIERARIKMTTEMSTAEVSERAAFRATLMAEVNAMRVMMKECESDKYALRERLNTAEGQILILKASNEIMERWVSFFKDRNSPNARAAWQEDVAVNDRRSE